jgi:hypothetical protein
MTRYKNGRLESAAQQKNSMPSAKRKAEMKISPSSQTAFKQQRGRQRGGNSRDQAPFRLSYENSQRAVQTQQKDSFNSFFAPSQSRFDQPKIVELGILIRKHWVGGLIGKKGKTIWMIRDKSQGANIDFGCDDIIIDRNKDKLWDQPPWPEIEKENFTVCAISGTKQQATDAALAIAEQIAKAAQSTDYRLEFLIPESYVGIFIGKKGVNVQQMKGPPSDGITINIRDEPIMLGSNRTTLCTLFGPAESMVRTIERTAKWLGDISIRVQMDREAEQPISG